MLALAETDLHWSALFEFLAVYCHNILGQVGPASMVYLLGKAIEL